MKASFSLIPLITSFVGFSGLLFAHASPAPAPQDGPLDIYDELWDLCEAGGEDSYVGVLYKNGTLTTYNFNQCYPYELPDDNLAKQAVFCKSVTCENNPNPDCTGGAVPPVPIPVPAGVTLVNVADFVQIIGQGATCQSNGLPL